jgi:hypothetical protein
MEAIKESVIAVGKRRRRDEQVEPIGYLRAVKVLCMIQQW